MILSDTLISLTHVLTKVEKSPRATPTGRVGCEF